MSVTVGDIAIELGRATPTGDQAMQWESWITQARYLIGKRLGDVAALDQGDVDYVVLQAVVAHVRNPDDATQVSVQVDDANVSRSYRTSRGRVTILDEWWSLLSPTTGVGRGFEIDTMPNPTVLR